MFATIMTNIRLSQAAVVVENLLKMHGIADTGIDRASIANKLVSAVHDELPEIVGGKKGKRPHKFSLAAMALAEGALFYANNRQAQLCFGLGLGTILLELSKNPHLHALTANDHLFINAAEEIYHKVM